MLYRCINIIMRVTLIMVLCSTQVFAVTLTGKVTSREMEPMAGVQITLTSEDRLFAETVYTNKEGTFKLITRQKGFAQLRARKLQYADATQTIELDGQNTDKLTFKLRKLSNPREISDNLTASAHFSRVKFDDPKALGFFKVDCLTCHQLGSAHTRVPRSKELWDQITERMLAIWGMKDKSTISEYSDVLMKAFDGTPLELTQRQAVDPLTFKAHITQWKLPEGLIAHDVEYHEADGKFYTVDQGRDYIYITDPETNRTETFKIPNDGIPIGGKFFRLHNEPHPFTLSVSRGPHSLQEGPDGKFYTTDTVSGQIGVFDPKTRKYTGYDIGGRAMYPHTLRFDKEGKVWFTLSVSNQVGRFDPVTKEMLRIDLPPTTDRPEFPSMTPYGIDIHPLDGSVWYSRLSANRIGRIDPKTLEVTEITPSFIGPRRMRFDKEGTLWIPSYGNGTLEKLDTKTMQFTSFTIPPLSPSEMEAPYAVGVHPTTQEVWITANMSDRMFRFLPNEERFVPYPLPTKGIFLRDVIFTPEGQVCAASSTALPSLTLEGGMEEVVCIAPDFYDNS